MADPTFGQKKRLRFKGDKGPFKSPVYNITELQNYDGYLTVNSGVERQIRELSKFAFPAQVEAYVNWAAMNPQMDPRTWLPLAQGGVKPDSEEGQAISSASIAADVDAGTFSSAPGVKQTPVGNNPTSAPSPLTSQPTMFAPVPPGEGTEGVATQPASAPPDDNILMGAANWVGGQIADSWDFSVSQFQTAARAVQYGLMSGYDAMQAAGRTASGLSERQQQIAKAKGLTPEEAALAFPATVATGFAGKDVTAGSAPAERPTTGQSVVNNLGRIGPGGGMMSGFAIGNTQQDAATWDSLPDDRKALIQQARDEYAALDESQPLNVAKSIARQTPAGAIAEDPSLLTDDKGWLAGNQDVYLRNEAASVVAFDMRTADEVARGVAPVGWTPGRGIAHNWWAPDTQEFNTYSGVIDFFANLGGDPVNAIPLNAAGKVGKGALRVTAKGVERFGGDGSVIPGAIERGMRNGPKIAIQTTQSGGYKGAREAARGRKVMDDLGVTTRVVDPDLAAATGAKFDETTGLVTSPHGNIVMSQYAWDFLNSGRGTKIVDALVEAKSASTIWLQSNRKIDVALAKQLADAKTAAEVRGILGTRLGMELDDPRALRNFGSSAPGLFKNMALRDNALIQMLRKAPHAKPIDLDNKDNAVTMLERFGRGAGMKWDEVAPHLDNLLATSSSEGMFKAIYGEQGKGGFFGAVAKHLAEDVGIPEAEANKITRAFKGGLDEELRNYVNEGIAYGTTGAGGDAATKGWAMLESEMFNRLAAIPDYRTVRAASHGVGRILRSNLSTAEKTDAIGDAINGATTIWKGAVLARPAYVAREVGEMTVAASLAGYPGLFTHPSRFTSLALATIAQKEASTAAGRMMRALALGEMPQSGNRVTKPYRVASAPVAAVKTVADYMHLTQGMRLLFPSFNHQQARVNGDGMWDALNHYIRTGDESALTQVHDSMAAVAGNYSVDEGLSRLASRQVGVVARDSAIPGSLERKRYVNGLIWKLGQMSRDGDMRALAKGDFREAVRKFQASGRADKKRIANASRYQDLSDEQIMQQHAQVLQDLTGNDPVLIQAIADGTFNSLSITKSNRDLVKHIEAMLDDPTKASVMKDTMRFDSVETDAKIRTELDKAMTRFFNGTGEVSDMLQRGPLLREAYVRRVIALVPEMTPAAKAAAVKRIRETGDTKLAHEIATAGPARGVLEADDVDHIASSFARRESQRIFYDAHERQNYALALRAVMPFAQATFNTIRRWGELSMRNPQLMYRTLKPLNYAHQPGSAAIYGALGGMYGDASTALYDPGSYGYSTPDTRHNSVDGFFYTDQVTGDRMFSYPIIGLLGNLAGIPSAAMNSGAEAGLNVAGTGIQPGFGPSITLPASFFAQHAISREDALGDVTRFFFPYGLPEGSPAEKLWSSFAPSWAAKLSRSADENTVANLATKMVPVLYQNGGYDAASASDQARLWNDASDLAGRLYIFNAFFGALTPSTINSKPVVRSSGPGGEWSSDQASKMADAIYASDPNDTNGDFRRFVLQDKLKQEWNRYTQGAGGIDAYREGMLHFVHDYGLTGLFSVLPTTKAADGQAAVQATNDVWTFRTQEPEAYSENQEVIGLFFAGGAAFTSAEDKGPTGFSLPLYNAQKAAGERRQKQGEFVTDAMREYGWMLYNPKAAEIDASNMSASQIAAAKDRLNREVMDITGGAWTRQPLDAGKRTRLIEQLKDAVNDDAIKSLASAPYIITYLDKRDEVIESLQHQGKTANFKNKGNRSDVEPLITLAMQLQQADKTGAFTNAWNRVFVSEFGED